MADQARSSELSGDKSDGLLKRGAQWAADNVAKPLYNALVVDTWNTMANIQHVGGATPERLQFGKLDKFEEKHADIGTAEWIAQGASRGLGSILPYVGSSLAAGALLQRSAKVLQVSEATSRALASPMAANLGGAAAFNYFRDVEQGESTTGNVVGGTLAMAAYSLSNPWIKGTLGTQMLKRSAVGAAIGPTTLAVSDYATTGELPSWDKNGRYLEAAAGGMVFNSLLPLAQDKATKGIDHINVQIGRGVRLDRYMDERGLSAASLRADNAKLPTYAQFELGGNRVLDQFAPLVPHARVQPIESTAVPYRGKNVIHLRQGELTAFNEVQPPQGLLSTAEMNLWKNVQTRKLEAEILGREVSQRAAAEGGTAAGGILSNLGIRKAITDGRLKITVPDEQGNLVPYKPDATRVGPNSLDVRLDKVFSVQNGGQDISTAKASLKQNVASYETGIHPEGFWLEPRGQAGDRVLGQTIERFHMPAGPRVEWNGERPLMADIEGTTWLARNNLRVHQTANTVHNETNHPITLEFVNESDNRIFLKYGETIGQMKFKPIDSYPEGLSQQSNTNGQHSPTGPGQAQRGAEQDLSKKSKT